MNVGSTSYCVLLTWPLAPPGAWAIDNFSPTSHVLSSPLQLLAVQLRLGHVRLKVTSPCVCALSCRDGSHTEVAARIGKANKNGDGIRLFILFDGRIGAL